jgi:hypothetical protein
VAFGVIVVARARGVAFGVIVVADHAALGVVVRTHTVALGVVGADVEMDHVALGVFVGTLPVIGHRRPPLQLLVVGMTTAINVPDRDLGRLSTR